MKLSRNALSRIAIFGLVAMCGPSRVSSGADAQRLDRSSVVLVYQISGHPTETNADSLKDNPRLESYPILDNGIISSSATIRRLGTLVAAERRAERNPSACFYPGMALAFVSEAEVVKVLICLECQNMSGPGSGSVIGMSEGAAEEFAILYSRLFRDLSSGGAR